jgi:hypothetical protein
MPDTLTLIPAKEMAAKGRDSDNAGARGSSKRCASIPQPDERRFTAGPEVKRMFDLDMDRSLIEAVFRRQSGFGELWDKSPGLRVAKTCTCRL